MTRTETASPRQRIAVPSLRGLALVPVVEIRYFLAGGKYVTIRHGEGAILSRETLVNLEAEFGHRFLRIHRNALVAVRFIVGLERLAAGRFRLRMAGAEERLPISRRLMPEVRRRLSGMADSGTPPGDRTRRGN